MGVDLLMTRNFFTHIGELMVEHLLFCHRHLSLTAEPPGKEAKERPEREKSFKALKHRCYFPVDGYKSRISTRIPMGSLFICPLFIADAITLLPPGNPRCALIKQLKDSEPFNGLPEKVFQEIRAAANQSKYPPEAYIFQEKDPPTGYLYVIKEGLVEITVLTPGGVDMVVDYRKEGNFFGGTPIFTGEPYTGGARTVKATECYLIPQDILRRCEKDHPQLAEYFTRVVLSRVRHLYAEIVSDHNRKALTRMEAYPFKKTPVGDHVLACGDLPPGRYRQTGGAPPDRKKESAPSWSPTRTRTTPRDRHREETWSQRSSPPRRPTPTPSLPAKS